MNEQQNPSDPYGVITSAEQLVAALYEAEKIEEKTKDAPPGSEAVEDEVRALTAAVNRELQRLADADPETRGITVRFRIFELHRCIGADVPIWRVGGCDEGPCGDLECRAQHHNPGQYLVTKRADGSYAILEKEEVIDERDKNHACFMQGMQGMVQINLGDIVNKAVQDAISEAAKEMAQPDDGGEDDPLPPAASVEVVPDAELLRKIKETALGRPLTSEEEQNVNASWETVQARIEQTKPMARVDLDDDTDVRLPVIDIDEYRLVRHSNALEVRSGWLRRAWIWLCNWLRS